MGVGIVFLVFLGLGTIGALLPPISNQPQASSSSSASYSSTSTSTSPIFLSASSKVSTSSKSSSTTVTTTQTTSTKSSAATTTKSTTTDSSITLQDIISGKFPSAKDKSGTDGVQVTVTTLVVLSVRSESDGDWHVAVTDGKVPVFITEVTPAYQSIGKPLVGATIDETGIPYCDTYHQTESWHGNTCWEIHPVMLWSLSTSGITTTKTNQTALSSLNVAISYARNPISRGSIQNITVAIADSDGPVFNTAVSVQVDYASGQTTKYFMCTTLTQGSCSVAWRIGGNSTPGTFYVKVLVEGASFYSSFEVTTA